MFFVFFPTTSKRASINAATLKLSTGAKSRQSRWGVGLQVTSGLVHSKRKSVELLLSATQHSKVSGARPLNKIKLLPLPGSEGMDVNYVISTAINSPNLEFKDLFLPLSSVREMLGCEIILTSENLLKNLKTFFFERRRQRGTILKCRWERLYNLIYYFLLC